MTSNKTQNAPYLPLKVRLTIAFASLVENASRRSDGTINRCLVNLADLKVPPSPTKPIEGVTSTDITIDSSRSLWFRLFTPSTTTTANDSNNDVTSLPVIIYIHGGGFAFFAANSRPFDRIGRRLARDIPAIVVSVNYRLSPEHLYPCQYDDGFEVLKFIDDHKLNDKFPPNADLRRCFIAGDSAGGNIAHHVALRSGEHEFKEVKLIGLIAIQPFFGGEERTESEIRFGEGSLIPMKGTDWMWKSFLPDGSDRDHPVVNVFGPKSVDISGAKFPSTLLIMGGFDPLQDWQKRYYEGLKRCGKQVELIEYPNAIHGFNGFPDLPEYALLFKDVRTFVQKQVTNA